MPEAPFWQRQNCARGPGWFAGVCDSCSTRARRRSVTGQLARLPQPAGLGPGKVRRARASRSAVVTLAGFGAAVAAGGAAGDVWTAAAVAPAAGWALLEGPPEPTRGPAQPARPNSSSIKGTPIFMSDLLSLLPTQVCQANARGVRSVPQNGRPIVQA